jgi:hypothetical protein
MFIKYFKFLFCLFYMCPVYVPFYPCFYVRTSGCRVDTLINWSALSYYFVGGHGYSNNTLLNIQGGSNMTGTDCVYLLKNQSRSYLNHLVHSGWGRKSVWDKWIIKNSRRNSRKLVQSWKIWVRLQTEISSCW